MPETSQEKFLTTINWMKDKNIKEISISLNIFSLFAEISPDSPIKFIIEPVLSAIENMKSYEYGIADITVFNAADRLYLMGMSKLIKSPEIKLFNNINEQIVKELNQPLQIFTNIIERAFEDLRIKKLIQRFFDFDTKLELNSLDLKQVFEIKQFYSKNQENQCLMDYLEMSDFYAPKEIKFRPFKGVKETYLINIIRNYMILNSHNVLQNQLINFLQQNEANGNQINNEYLIKINAISFKYFFNYKIN